MKRKYILALLLAPIMCLTSCVTVDNSSTQGSNNDTTQNSTGGGSNNQSNPEPEPEPVVVSQVDFYVNTSIKNKSGGSLEGLNNLWIWNSTGSMYFENVLNTSETVEVQGASFYKGSLKVGDVYENVHGDWGLTDTAQTVTITTELLSSFTGMLFRNAEGSAQTNDLMYSFADFNAEITSVYHVLANGNQVQTVYTVEDVKEILDNMEKKPVIPADIDTYSFYYYRENPEDYKVMNTVHIWNFEGTTSVTIRPDWELWNFTINDRVYQFAKFDIQFVDAYDGASSWNYDPENPEQIVLTKDYLTGGFLVRSEDGSKKTSDIKFDWAKMDTMDDYDGTIYYIDRKEADWKGDYELVYRLGDLYYSDYELQQALEHLEGKK